MASFKMTSTLSPRAITYKEGLARTMIDLCWMSFGLLDRITTCQVDGTLDHDLDHLPISTVLDVQIQHHAQKPLRQWKKLDTDKFCEMLKGELPTLHRPRTVEALERYVEYITKAIVVTADQVLALRKPLQKAREGWTAQCSEVLAEAKCLKRAHGRTHTDCWPSLRREASH